MKRTHGGAWLWTLALGQGALIVWFAFALLRGRSEHASAVPPTATPMPAAAATPESGPVEVVAGAPPEPVPAVVPTSASAPLAVPTHAVLFGAVSGKGSKRPRRASISVNAGSASQPIATATIADEATEYALPGLAPGTYRLRVHAQDFREHDEAIEVPAGTDHVRHDVVLSPSWLLAVEFVDTDGSPLGERFLVLRKEHPHSYMTEMIAVATFTSPPAELPPTDLRDPDVGIGRWLGGLDPGRRSRTLDVRFAGMLELPEDRPLFVSAVMRTAVLATERVDAGQEEVRLTVPFERALGSLGSVRVQIVEGDTGRPVTSARVALSDSQSSHQGQPVDAEGKIELRLQRPGLLNLDVTAGDRVALAWNVELAPGASLDLGPLPVFAPVELKASLVDAPPGEVQVALTTLDTPPHPALRARAGYRGSARGGEWSTRVAPGRYRVRATGSGALGVVEIDTRKLAGEPFRIDMQPTARLRVTPPTDRRVQLAVRDATGTLHFRRWLSWTAAFDVHVWPGDYTIELTPFGGEPAPGQRVHVGAEGAELDLR